jgi:hypothetical protein
MTGVGASTIQNGGTNTQIGGTGTVNGGAQTGTGGTAQNGGTGAQNGGTATQIGGAINQNGGTGTQNGNTVTTNGGNTGQNTGANTQSTSQPQYHIVLNSKGEHVLVQSTGTPGKFTVIKTISNEKLANYLIGKLSSSTSSGSPIPKSLSGFASDHSNTGPALPMVEGSHFNMNPHGYHAVHDNTPSQQVGVYGTQEITANGIGGLGGEQVSQIPTDQDGNIHQVNTNPYVHVTGIGTLGGSSSDSQPKVPGLKPGPNAQATGIGSLGGDDGGNGDGHAQFTGMVKPLGIGTLGNNSLKQTNVR